MARTKLDYGIDLGTTNSAISRMESGDSLILKSTDQKDTMPSCISFNRRGHKIVGDAAFRQYQREVSKSLSRKIDINSFVEFKRTMGTDKKYFVSNIDKELTSEELSAEVLKQLKSYVQNEIVDAAVITVPAAFKNNQIDATRRAAEIAGFSQVEMIQEPVAAAIAYGIDTKNKDGRWLVFDFGGGTFDAALLRVEEGIMEVTDSEGDNHLGGKNLDLAIVDEILIPYLSANYNLEETLANDSGKQALRNAMKFYAEEAKNILSIQESYNIYVDPEDAGEDDDGEEIEIDITLTQSDMVTVLSPVFQRAIDKCKMLLDRNNLRGDGLDSLVLVGGPTFSPVLRKMLADQITDPDTSVDPMTVVARGAALYASTVSLSEEISEKTRDRSKIQIEIGHESSTVEKDEWVSIKILKDRREGIIPHQVFAEITRHDNAWSSGKIRINELGELIEVQLIEDKTNNFTVTLFDGEGNFLESEPRKFTIIQGVDFGTAQGLTLNWGIEILRRDTEKMVFHPVKGLEKNKSLPAVGTINDLKTQKQIRPGIDSDFIKIPLYQGEHGADGTRAIHNEHVYDIIISGTDLPALLPENSSVDLTINIDKSQKVLVQAYFPYLDHTTEVEVPPTVQSVGTIYLTNEFRKAKGSIQELRQDGDNSDLLERAESDLKLLEMQFKNNPNDVDNKQEVLSNLRQTLKIIDAFEEETEWPKLEEELKTEFYKLEDANKEMGDDESSSIVNQLRLRLEQVIHSKDVKLGYALLEEINSFFIRLTFIYQLIGFIQHHNENFDSYQWKDRMRARQLLNEGLRKIGGNEMVDELHPIVISLIDLLPVIQRPSGDDSILMTS